MISTIILAGSYQEASRYAAAKGLRNWRRVTSSENLAGLRPERAIILPGFHGAPSFGLKAGLDRLVRDHGTAIITDRLPAAPPAPSYGEPGYRADLTFGDLVGMARIPEKPAEPVLAPRPRGRRKPRNKASAIDELFD